MRELEGKAALVTGAGRGIGRAVALAFARAGAALAVCARGAGELDGVRREIEAIGARAFARPCDVSDPAAAREFVGAAAQALGAFDVLVNNAGRADARRPLAETSDEAWRGVMGTNLDGAFFMTREVLRAGMLARGSGCVINVSSGLGVRVRPNWGAYAPSKHALEALTREWAQEAPAIRFYVLDPGTARTRMRADTHPGEDPASLNPPETVARAFVELASGRLERPSGSRVELDANGAAR